MARYDLTDAEWLVIQPVLPQKSRGVPRVDDRRVLNGIFWVQTTAPRGRIPPVEYGDKLQWQAGIFVRRRAGTLSHCR